MREEESRITVGELREQLSGYSDDTEITFGCTLDAVPLIFYRVKTRGEKLVQIELNELHDEEVEGDETIEDKIRAIVLEEFYEVLIDAEPDMEHESRQKPLIAGARTLHVLRHAVDQRLRDFYPVAYDRMGRRIMAGSKEQEDSEDADETE